MPSNLYNGVAVFGVAVKMSGGPAPRALQVNEYAGQTGKEVIDLGGRGRITKVTGALNQANRTALANAKFLLDSYVDGVARPFYDSDGFLWTNVLMHPAEYGKIRGAASAGFWVEYSLALEHLTQT